MREKTKPFSIPPRGARPLQNLTTRFIVLYILLVFLPTVVFIGIYSATLSRQQRSEARYSEQLMLSQTASYLGDSLTRDEAFLNAFQGENMLINLLEGGFSSPSEELMACITYVQPMLTSILATNPFVRDLYIYRYEPSFIANSDLVFNLPMVGEFPYDPALLAGNQLVRHFLVTEPASVRHLKGYEPTSAQYVSLIQIYNRSFSKVIGMMEVQIDIDRVLTSLEPTQNDGEMYLLDEDTGIGYPVRFSAEGVRLSWGEGVQPLPLRSSAQEIRESVKGTNLSLVYRMENPAAGIASLWRNVMLVMLILLIPTTVVCVFVFRYAARLARFGAHIEGSREASLKVYREEEKDDELGAVVSAYNGMVDTIHTLVDQVRQAEQLKNAATYYAMSSQVNPHFMFNTLENIRMQIEMENYDDANQMLFVLGRFLRYNISLRRESTLADELTHIEHYLMIYRYRAQRLIRYSIDIPDDVEPMQVRCPFCMLQPIVENCVKHGIRDGAALTIRIGVHVDDAGLVISVADNGSGMSREEVVALNASFKTPELREQSAGAHVGLGNVNARVKYFYGNAYGLVLTRAEDGGLETAVHIGRKPLENALGKG